LMIGLHGFTASHLARIIPLNFVADLLSYVELISCLAKRFFFFRVFDAIQ
jgi:hypothetical protein